jgi:hypothetical protein
MLHHDDTTGATNGVEMDLRFWPYVVLVVSSW